ncbi:uncharacterized protein TRAVEDRAFT_131884 [Trametes versicolor FP-101664 SS1]|uniref:uncharacterized protein n=1 Tax=Trametes versicolor (strain FP-101664) TaxID=717944 RepID=UPI0004622D4F|nr:uncharacterized protein TRAVEDRAFT_131884 [Trametes versicolor FP-101664 SS1]EIW53821.1 hypothetical protein TRAVEDRAFT_131884 [Trametes versicolor FP-101664 SS1]
MQGELEHRHVKRFYARTNKIGYELQIAKHLRRAALMRAIRQLDDYVPRRERLRQDRLAHMAPPSMSSRPEPSGHDADTRPDSPLPPTNPLVHYAISNTSRLALGMRNWISKNRNDPAADNFIPLLRAHLLGRLLDLPPGEGGGPGVFTDAQLDHIEVQNDRIYSHKVLRINYTTYDIRRDQDIIKPTTHPDIMLLADDPISAHPFWYARVIDIFHANVRYTGAGATRLMREGLRMDFLWVRWYRLDNDNTPAGFQEARLPRLSFVDANDLDTPPFGFVNPSDVVRGAYLLPAFHHGFTDELLLPSPLARHASENDEDYRYYYACM